MLTLPRDVVDERYSATCSIRFFFYLEVINFEASSMRGNHVCFSGFFYVCTHTLAFVVFHPTF